MDRRARRRRARLHLPSAIQLLQVKLPLMGHPLLQLSPDSRTVKFVTTGKKFWTFDLSSIQSFVTGRTYLREASYKAKLPDTVIQCGDGTDVKHTWIRVPVDVSARISPIAVALHNQLVLGSACAFAFPSLAMGAYRAREILTAEAFEELRAQSLEANSAKHIGLQDKPLEVFSILRREPHEAGPGQSLPPIAPALAAPSTPAVAATAARDDTPPPVRRESRHLGGRQLSGGEAKERQHHQHQHVQPPEVAPARLWKALLPASEDSDEEGTPLAVLEVREVIEGRSDVTVSDLDTDITQHRQRFAVWARQAIASVAQVLRAQIIEAAAAAIVKQAYSEGIGVDFSDLDVAVLSVDVASDILSSFFIDGQEDSGD